MSVTITAQVFDDRKLRNRPGRWPDPANCYPTDYPISFCGSFAGRFFRIINCFYWWAHKDSNLGPAD